jgi:hypothetical protein
VQTSNPDTSAQRRFCAAHSSVLESGLITLKIFFCCGNWSELKALHGRKQGDSEIKNGLTKTAITGIMYLS